MSERKPYARKRLALLMVVSLMLSMVLAVTVVPLLSPKVAAALVIAYILTFACVVIFIKPSPTSFFR